MVSQMPRNLADVFRDAEELVDLPPETLAGVIIELRSDAKDRPFTYHDLINVNRRDLSDRRVILAVYEAMSWLNAQGLLMRDPEQPGEWFLFTRRGRSLNTRQDVDAFRKASILPMDLISADLSERVRPSFLNGQYGAAVFQAFLQVEVAVRDKAGLGPEFYGVNLMRKAFHEETGVLRNVDALVSERQAERDLFAGAIGYAKNPPGHRDVNHEPVEAARLILFATQLLDMVARKERVEVCVEAA